MSGGDGENPKIPDEVIDQILKNADPNDPSTWSVIEIETEPDADPDPDGGPADPHGVALKGTDTVFQQLCREAEASLADCTVDRIPDGGTVMSDRFTMDVLELEVSQIAGDVEPKLRQQNAQRIRERAAQDKHAHDHGVPIAEVRAHRIALARMAGEKAVLNCYGWLKGGIDGLAQVYPTLNQYFGSRPFEFHMLMWVLSML